MISDSILSEDLHLARARACSARGETLFHECQLRKFEESRLPDYSAQAQIVELTRSRCRVKKSPPRKSMEINCNLKKKKKGTKRRGVDYTAQRDDDRRQTHNTVLINGNAE